MTQTTRTPTPGWEFVPDKGYFIPRKGPRPANEMAIALANWLVQNYPDNEVRLGLATDLGREQHMAVMKDRTLPLFTVKVRRYG